MPTEFPSKGFADIFAYRHLQENVKRTGLKHLKDSATRKALFAEFFHKNTALVKMHDEESFAEKLKEIEDEYQDVEGLPRFLSLYVDKIKRHALHPLASRTDFDFTNNQVITLFLQKKTSFI